MKAAEACLRAARSILARDDVPVHRWESEVQRLKQEVDRGVVDAKVLSESRSQLESSIAERDAAKATTEQAEAELHTQQAAVTSAMVDVRVAQAELKVAESEQRRTAAWVRSS